MKFNLIKVIVPLAVLFSTFTSAEEARHIHVNGECLSAEDIQLVDMLFKTQVSNGFYWINFDTGVWGYENNEQPAGTVPLIAESLEQQQHKRSNSSDTIINQSQNGSVVSGNVGGKNCTFASVGGTTVKLCD